MAVRRVDSAYFLVDIIGCLFAWQQ